MASGITFAVDFGRKAAAAARRNEAHAFRILLLGDFSGRASRADGAALDLGHQRIRRVDVDNFEQVFAAVAPHVRLMMGAAADSKLDIPFGSPDDLHPDALYANGAIFKGLRALRARLQDNATFADAARELRESGVVAAPSDAPPAPKSPGASGEADSATLARLLGGVADAPTLAAAVAHAPADPLRALVRGIVAPHIVADAPAHQAQYLAALDAAIAEQMRAILHHPVVQAVESAWRALRWLIAEADVGDAVQVHVLDVAVADLHADLESCGGVIAQSGLYRLLVENGSAAPGGQPWSYLAGCFELRKESADIRLLEFLGGVAAQAGGPLVAGAADCFAGCDSLAASPDPRTWQLAAPDADLEANWQALRRSPVARWIGLALPRVMLRMPYGAKTDPISAFPFEEFGGKPNHAQLLWGGAAVGCALLAARSFASSGWDMTPDDERDLEGLPAYVYLKDGDRELMPAAETYLGERAVEALIGAGLIPLASMKNRNSVRVPRVQSIALPAAALAGAWGGA